MRRLGHILDRASRSIVFAAVALVLAACASVAVAPPASRHLILISIDALRPEFYLDASFDAPTLRALVAEGSHARAVEGVFPTVTYPSHSTVSPSTSSSIRRASVRGGTKRLRICA